MDTLREARNLKAGDTLAYGGQIKPITGIRHHDVLVTMHFADGSELTLGRKEVVTCLY